MYMTISVSVLITGLYEHSLCFNKCVVAEHQSLFKLVSALILCQDQGGSSALLSQTLFQSIVYEG